MSEVICSRCNHPNSEASNYCSSCGFDLHRAEQEATTELAAVSVDDDPETAGASEVDTSSIVGTATFVVKRGSMAGSRFAVNDEFTSIGRHPESTIFLDDVTVSRRHAEVRVEGEAVLLRDVGSLNGTYLNRTRIDTASLRSGDEVQVGKFKLVFVTDAP